MVGLLNGLEGFSFHTCEVCTPGRSEAMSFRETPTDRDEARHGCLAVRRPRIPVLRLNRRILRKWETLAIFLLVPAVYEAQART